MANKRSTYDVEALKIKINDVLLNSVDDYKYGRDAVRLVLEQVLLETGNYKGYRSLCQTDMLKSKNGTTYGIDENYIDGNERDENGNLLKFKNTDHTRVRYF